MYLYGCLEANYIGNNKYECLKCVEEFIPLVNDRTCVEFSKTNLSNYCLEAAINIGDESNIIFSCNKCDNEKVLISNSNNISDCYERAGNLSYCEKGVKTKYGELFCIECVSHAHLNLSKQCECNYDSFGLQNLFCYKCDDEIEGNPGCIAREGCEYIQENDQLICNKCKDYYFKKNKGECSVCSDEKKFCNKCHLDEVDKLICDECFDNFTYNQYDNTCQLNCEEYPEISPGCIICNDEYKLKRKCQACKPGYFKTDNESCVYCRSDKFGGNACNKCMKNKTDDNIICEVCEGDDRILSSRGKCYFINKAINK